MNRTRKFLERVLSSGLDCGVLGPEDIVRHVTPVLLARHLPKLLLAKLIRAGLAAKRFDAALIVDTLGIADLAAHIPVAALWKIVDDAAATVLSGDQVDAKRAPAVKPVAGAEKSAGKHEGKAGKDEDKADTSDKSAKADKKASKDKGKSDKGKSDKAKAGKREAEVPEVAAEPGKTEVPVAAAEPGKTEVPVAAAEPDKTEVPEVGSSRAVTAPAVPSSKAMPTGGQPPPLQPPPEAMRKPNVSSRPETQPGRVAKADVRVPLPGMPAIHNDVTVDTSGEGDEAMDFDVDTMVGETPPAVEGTPPPRMATIDPEVEHALAGLEMEEVILDEFEIGEEEILDESVKFDDASSVGKK